MRYFEFKIWCYYYAMYYGCMPVLKNTKIYPAQPAQSTQPTASTKV